MRIIKKPQITLNFDNTINLTLQVEKSNLEALNSLIDGVEYDLEIKKATKKRSISQNAYLWTLLRQLADKQKMGHEEMYKFYIREYGVYDVVALIPASRDRFITMWQSKGTGWFVDVITDTYCRVFYGSSSYSKEEMNRILEQVTLDCESAGIPTHLDFRKLKNENEA